jgi:hypothetical protein
MPRLMQSILFKDPVATESLRAAARAAGVPTDGDQAAQWAVISRRLRGDRADGPKATSLRQLLTYGRLVTEMLDGGVLRDRKEVLRALQEDVLGLSPGRI